MVRGAGAASVDEAEQEKIRLIVKQVLREYAATLNDKAGNEAAKAMLKNVVQDNQRFVQTHKADHFSHFQTSQHPRATVITCSDSRVHTHALDGSPDGDMFMIRNIGNQISTAEGSVEYGVHHLHTPLLLIVGHVACGAIKAASGDYAKESGPIRNELDTIQIPKGEGGLSSVKLNVNNQVRQAMNKFEEEVLKGTLTIVGAVYDFKNEMGQGHGKLNIINVNGETDAGRIARLDLMQGLDAPPPKPGRASRRTRAPAAPAAEEHAGGH
ncbi:MAG: carbonic anhydrase [Thiobacillus sp.]|nr:carbonic anhydrase [Thiobacillus sp.]